MSNRVTAIQMPEGLMQNKAVTGMQQLAKDFKAFLARGSLIDLAVGIIIGGAFNTIVQSFVNDIITPIISLIGQKNLGELRCSGYPFASLKAQQENLFLVIKCNASSTICHTGENSAYATIAIAQTDGAVTWNYGRFIQNVIYFLIVSVVMFFVVKVYTQLIIRPKVVAEEAKAATKTCEMCLEDIHVDAKKCKHCGSSL